MGDAIKHPPTLAADRLAMLVGENAMTPTTWPGVTRGAIKGVARQLHAFA